MKIGYVFSNLMMGGVQTFLADFANRVSVKHEVAYCVLSDAHSDSHIQQMLSSIPAKTPAELLSWSDVIHLDGINQKEARTIFGKQWSKTLQHVGSKRKVRPWNWRAFSPNPVSVSHHVASTLWGLKKTMIYTGVDTKKFRPMPEVEKKYDVIFLGRLRDVKGPGRFLDICEAGSFSFLIVGGTHSKGHVNDYEKRARQMARPGIDRVTGFVAHNDVPVLINQARVAVVPSESEALGFNALEPMACGVPAVARNVGGLPESLGSDSPLLVPADAPPEDYVKVIREYLNSKTMSIKVRKRIEEVFDINTTLEQYLKLYSQIASK